MHLDIIKCRILGLSAMLSHKRNSLSASRLLALIALGYEHTKRGVQHREKREYRCLQFFNITTGGQ